MKKYCETSDIENSYGKIINAIKSKFLSNDSNYSYEDLINQINEKKDVLLSQNFIEFLKKEIENVIFDEISWEVNKELLNFYMNFLTSIIEVIKIENTRDKITNHKVISELEKQKSIIEQILDLKDKELETTQRIANENLKYKKLVIELRTIFEAYWIGWNNAKLIEALEGFKAFLEILEMVNELFPDENITDDELVSKIERISKWHIWMKKLVDELLKIWILEREKTWRNEVKDSWRIVINWAALAIVKNKKIVNFEEVRNRRIRKPFSLIKWWEWDVEWLKLDKFESVDKQQELINSQQKEIEKLILELEKSKEKEREREREKQEELEKLRLDSEQTSIKNLELQNIINWLERELLERWFSRAQIEKMIKSYKENQ
jgi:hypothetical protein